jgi:hypothetical protein
MNARQRSLSGLVLAIILIPVLAGLLACLPVPIGDPERSRVDADLDGIWLWGEGVAMFESYDKRTWLLSTYKIRDLDCTTKISGDVEDFGYDGFVAKLRGAGTSCLKGDLTDLYKVWLTDIGQGEFMTWEPKGGFDEEDAFDPDIWYVWRLVRNGREQFILRLVDPEFEGFEEPGLAAKLETLADQRPNNPKLQKSTRRDVERMIRRNLDNDDLYDDDSVFLRIKPEDYDLFVGRILPESESFDTDLY